MAAANITVRTLIATPAITLSSLSAFIQSSLTDAGLGSPHDTYVDSGSINLVYQIINDSTKLYGTVFFIVTLSLSGTSFQITYKLTWNYVTSTKISGAQSISVQSQSLSTSTTMQAYGINHTEIKGAILSQAGIRVPLFILRPLYKDTWWNEENYPWAFIFSASTMIGLSGLAGNPYYPNYPDFTFPDGTFLANQNDYTLNRSIWPMGLILLSTSRMGIPGYFQDLRQAAIYQVASFSRLESPSESWFVLSPGNGGLVLLANPLNVIS